MCIGAAVDGKNKDDARKNHGFTGMFRGNSGNAGIYKPIVDFGQAGATVPLLGFGYNLWKGVKEAIDSQGFSGFLRMVLRHRLWESVVR